MSATCGSPENGVVEAARDGVATLTRATLNFSWSKVRRAWTLKPPDVFGEWRLWTSTRKKHVLRHSRVPGLLIKISAMPEKNEEALDEPSSLAALCERAAGTPVAAMIAWTGAPFYIEAAVPKHRRLALPLTVRLAAFAQQLIQRGRLYRPRECAHFYVDVHTGSAWASRASAARTARSLVEIARLMLASGGYLDDMQLLVQPRDGRVYLVDPRRYEIAISLPARPFSHLLSPSRTCSHLSLIHI